jgi:hypothetical protein
MRAYAHVVITRRFSLWPDRTARSGPLPLTLATLSRRQQASAQALAAAPAWWQAVKLRARGWIGLS